MHYLQSKLLSVSDTAYATHSCACLQSMYEWRTVSCAWRPKSKHIYAVTPVHAMAMQYENDHDNQLLLLCATAHALRMQQRLL